MTLGYISIGEKCFQRSLKIAEGIECLPSYSWGTFRGKHIFLIYSFVFVYEGYWINHLEKASRLI